jgi:hypothetical protein
MLRSLPEFIALAIGTSLPLAGKKKWDKGSEKTSIGWCPTRQGNVQKYAGNASSGEI